MTARAMSTGSYGANPSQHLVTTVVNCRDLPAREAAQASQRRITNAVLSRSGFFLLFALSASFLYAPDAWCQQRVTSKGEKSITKLPKCTDHLSSVEVPNAPHGLFVLLFPGAKVNQKATQHLLHTPAVCGANVYVVWNNVDHGPGANPRYNWSSVDQQIAPWVAAGKVVNLIVWATGYGSRAIATPDYVFSKVPSVECPSFGRAPVFWDQVFMSSYQSFMSATVNKYGSNTSIGYIRFGLGAGGEIYPACMYALTEHGFSKGTWRKYLFEMLDYEKSLHSPKQLGVGLNAFGDPPDLHFTAEVAEHAVQNGMAIGNQGLTVEDARNDAAGRACLADWCRIFRRFRGKVPLVLQTGGVSHPDGSEPAGSMVDMLPFALSQHVQIFELYVDDLLVAYDPSDPNYARHHDEYQRVYESAASVLGGS
jgi:hypothetical protein